MQLPSFSWNQSKTNLTAPTLRRQASEKHSSEEEKKSVNRRRTVVPKVQPAVK